MARSKLLRLTLTLALLVLCAASSFAQGETDSGWLVRGMTPNALWRSDANLAIESTFPFLTLTRTTNPGDIYGESAVTAGAYDSAGTLQKQAGFNFVWEDASPNTGWACARIQASMLYGGGVNLNYVLANFCGGHGISFFGLVPADAVPDRLNVYGNLHIRHSANQNGRVNAEGFEIHDALTDTDTSGVTVSGSSCTITAIAGGIITGATCAP